MTLLKDLTDCSTLAVGGLDNQLVAEMNALAPSLLVQIDDLPVTLGEAVHPYLQEPGWSALKDVIASRGQRMIINSAYRTLAAQQLLRLHFENGRCGITAAARPGQSNHNNATAIDIEDSHGWQPYLEAHGWRKLGDWDDMHFDCVAPGIQDSHSIAVRAFQRAWNRTSPSDRLTEDGVFGPQCSDRLLHSPAEGFAVGLVPRILKLTTPLQMGKDVGSIQLALRSHGIDVGAADMIFSPRLAAAVRKFQQKNSLPCDGVVGAKVRGALGLA